ncbi:hypothetical protein KKB55_15550 [Myxococcota bacterium]|nr:hypothetical protein [Myxococcota bacterium]MBU1899154.1 hypothetical protein [Myxococcota bacterium]
MARRGDRSLSVSWVQALLAIATLMTSSALSYGAMKAQVEGLEARIEQLEGGLVLVRGDVASAREDLAEIRGGLRRD